MAVVSISRIQQRRGRKYSGTGLPQLASGELGWSIDSQELFIGNGSVSEGAPHVGNTRLLTELDIPNLKGESANLFSSLDYIYKASGSVRTFNIENHGTNYADGVYKNIILQWITGGDTPITLPSATITVLNGSVSAIVLITPGYGISYGATFTIPLNSLGIQSPGSQTLLLSVSSVTGPVIPIKYTSLRSVQSRLDDRVNSTDFGTTGNGITDDTVSLQNAINQLFLNKPDVITLYGKSTYGSEIIQAQNASFSLIGSTITGPGISTDTTIIAVEPGVSITMSNYSNSSETATQIFNIILPSNQFVAASNPECRVTLELPPGKYNISNSLYIPSYATIVGAGVDKTILNFNRLRTIIGDSVYNNHEISTPSAALYMKGAGITGLGISAGTVVSDVIEGDRLILNNVSTQTIPHNSFELTIVRDDAVIKFVNELSSPGAPGSIQSTTSNTQPKFVTIKNLSIRVSDNLVSGMQLDCVKNGLFENIKLYSTTNLQSEPSNYGINLSALTPGITSMNNTFNNIFINNFGYGIYSTHDILNNSFINGTIDTCTFGVVFGETSSPYITGKQYGPRNSILDNFKLSNIIKQGIWIKAGTSNIISNIYLENVANNQSVALPQIYSSINGNTVSNIFSDRWSFYSLPIRINYIPEVSGKLSYTFPQLTSVSLTYSLLNLKIFNLPVSASLDGVPNNSIIHEINYEYTSDVGGYTRYGTLLVTADILNNQITLSDDYNFIGNEDFLQSLNFSAEFTGSLHAISISYTNTLFQDTGILSFSYTSITR